MLASLTELRAYRVRGTDGEIGRFDDLCFPDSEWVVRYVVVAMEDLGREALLLSTYLGRLNRGTHVLSAETRREQVANTPPFDRSQPITRQEEKELHDLYGWPVYWWEQEHDIAPIGGLWEEERVPEQVEESAAEAAAETEIEPEGAQLLFAGDLVEVYGIQAEGGEVGTLQDLVVDDETWMIPYLVVSLPESQRVLLATDYVETIDLGTRDLYLGLPRDVILGGPVVSGEEPITPALARSLREYYDQYTR
jgi:hypothetical protein